MPKPVRLYWDSCAWLGFLNGEPDKKQQLQIIYDNARKGNYQIWTSTISMVEVNRLKTERDAKKPYDDENGQKITQLFQQAFVFTIPLSVDIAEHARQIYRNTSRLRKWQDAVHLASALRWSVTVLHTYDHKDLLHLDGQFSCANGDPLKICYPDETTHGPLFGKGVNG